jgi:hypothetical protein
MQPTWLYMWLRVCERQCNTTNNHLYMYRPWLAAILLPRATLTSRSWGRMFVRYAYSSIAGGGPNRPTWNHLTATC